MKNLIVLFVLVAVVFAVYARNRLFVRDPLGSVMRDGVKEEGAQVFINYANCGLIENDDPPRYMTVIEHGGHIGVPSRISCLHYLVCLLDADRATLVSPLPADAVESMDARTIRYRQGKTDVVVTLR